MNATVPQTGIRPLGNTVVVRHKVQNATTASGIAIPESSRQVGNEGEVVAVGPGRWQDGARIPMEVQIGDRVIFRRWNTSGLMYNGTPVLSMPESEILCVVDGDDDVSFEGTVK